MGSRADLDPLDWTEISRPCRDPTPEVTIFVCETVQLFCVVLCVLRAVHIFDFRLNDTHNKWRPVSVEGLHACCAGQLHSLVQGTERSLTNFFRVTRDRH